jgi:glycosyltransferase involved in cell wall biosynthesis
VEAFACGRGVLASDVGGIPDVIVHGETGLILPSGDVRAWASVLAVSSARDVLREMGRHGRIRVQHLFDSRGTTGRGYWALYQDALSLSLTGAVPS